MLIIFYKFERNGIGAWRSGGARRDFLLNRSRQRAAMSIARQESAAALKLLKAATETQHFNPITRNPKKLIRGLANAFADLAEHELKAAAIVMDPRTYHMLNSVKKSSLLLRAVREVINGDYPKECVEVFGFWDNVPIFVNTMISQSRIFVAANKNYTGVIPIRRPVTSLEKSLPDKGRMGFCATELIGMCLLNDFAVSRIEIMGTWQYCWWHVKQLGLRFNRFLNAGDF